MARSKKVSPGHMEEKAAAHKRVRKPDVSGEMSVHQVIQRLNDNTPGAADPESIKDLQRTIGNRLVGQLISPQARAAASAVQREPTSPASEDRELMMGDPTTTKTPGVGTPAPIPYPNTAAPAGAPKSTSPVKIENKETAIKSSKMGSSTGDEPGTMKGLPSMTNSSLKPGGSKIVVPTQSAVTVDPEATPPTPTPSPPSEEAEGG